MDDLLYYSDILYMNVDLPAFRADLCVGGFNVLCVLRAFKDLVLEMEVSRCHLESELFLLGFLQQRLISMMEDLHQVHDHVNV